MRKRVWNRWTGTALLGALFIAGCGSPSGGGDNTSSASGNTPVKMGVSALADLAPLYLGRDKGFFSDERIDLDLQPQQGGSVTITGVASGQFEAGFSNTTSLLIANAQGLPLRAIAPAAQVGTDPKTEDYSAIMVRADSPIRTPADLAGRTFAANTLAGQVDTTIKATLDNLGVDSSTVKFLEIPYPDQVAAINAGRIDAIAPIEPFVTLAKDAGLRIVVPGQLSTAIPNFTTGAYFTSAMYLGKHPDVIERLRKSIEKSLQYAAGHPDEVRAVIPKIASMDPSVARRISLAIYGTTFDRPSLVAMSNLIVKYELAEDRPDVDQLLEGMK